MFGRTRVRCPEWRGKKERIVQFFIILTIVILLAAVYLLHQWYTGELAGPSPFDDGDAA